MPLPNSTKRDVPSAPEHESELHLGEEALSQELSPETVTSPETEVTEPTEQKQESQSTEADVPARVRMQPRQENTSPASSVKSETLTQVEHILEEDLGATYSGLDAAHQQMFKDKGEETAQAITQLMSQAKVKVQKIFELIKAWLMVIPGINKWFVIQESKIKVDKIMRLKNKK